MKYEKDFFMKINCHANEWRETLHLEGSKNKWRIFYNKMDNNKYNRIFRKIDNVPKYLKNFGNYKLFIIYLIAIRFTTLFKKYSKIL